MYPTPATPYSYGRYSDPSDAILGAPRAERNHPRSVTPALAVSAGLIVGYPAVMVNRGFEGAWIAVLTTFTVAALLIPTVPFWVATRRGREWAARAGSTYRSSWKLLWTGLGIEVFGFAILATKVAAAASNDAQVRPDDGFFLWMSCVVVGIGTMFLAALFMVNVLSTRKQTPVSELPPPPSASR